MLRSHHLRSRLCSLHWEQTRSCADIPVAVCDNRYLKERVCVCERKRLAVSMLDEKKRKHSTIFLYSLRAVKKHNHIFFSRESVQAVLTVRIFISHLDQNSCFLPLFLSSKAIYAHFPTLPTAQLAITFCLQESHF